MPSLGELVIAEAHRRSSELLEDLVEGVRVDRGGHPVADRHGADRDPGLGAPGVRRQVVGELGDQQDGVVGPDWRRSSTRDACGDRLRRVRAAPAELRRLGQPVEFSIAPASSRVWIPGGRNISNEFEEGGLAGQSRLGCDDQRHAALDQNPQERRQLRVERAGTDQLDDRARRRWDVADGPPAPPWRGLGHGLSVGPGRGSVKRLAVASAVGHRVTESTAGPAIGGLPSPDWSRGDSTDGWTRPTERSCVGSVVG